MYSCFEGFIGTPHALNLAERLKCAMKTTYLTGCEEGLALFLQRQGTEQALVWNTLLERLLYWMQWLTELLTPASFCCTVPGKTHQALLVNTLPPTLTRS